MLPEMNADFCFHLIKLPRCAYVASASFDIIKNTFSSNKETCSTSKSTFLQNSTLSNLTFKPDGMLLLKKVWILKLHRTLVIKVCLVGELIGSLNKEIKGRN